MNSKYIHQKVEENQYAEWIEQNLFETNPQSKNNYSIVIPPPNVTGKLHLGHAWDSAIQDIIIRYQKLNGANALWLPGMDHAGIATQSKVEQRLSENNLSRYDLGREKFIEKSFEWKEEYASHIRNQWSKLGLALDYSKERFTLDANLSNAVSKVFVKLYEEGLIYQGNRIINWDPKLKTALSDIEVIYNEVNGNEHYFKYCFVDNPEQYLEVMTTRPETIFGDGALAVNPNDKRYQKLIGKYVFAPGNNIKIPIIADEYVDQEIGSGVVKITPAHDPNDFEVGKRHNIAPEFIMDLEAKMAKCDRVPLKYQGMDRYDCRAEFIKDMQEAGLLIKIKPITHSVGHSERSGVIVEPILSKQWFVKTKPLAQKAIELQKSENKINFYPERFEKIYLTWLENIQDWCISRQLWWGHRIPVWYHKETNEIYVNQNPPKDVENYTQDEDVLDTWFSSALWPFATLNWPEETALYNSFYPTSTLVTGYDIIFFWVARMTMMASHFTNKLPFKNVFIHGLIRDEQGRKMSKSLGNGIDPMDVIEQYGVDSLRYFLTTNATPGQDLLYSDEKLRSTWNYINKVYNIANYLEFIKQNNNYQFSKIDENQFDIIDKWIIEKFVDVQQYYHQQIQKFNFGEAMKKLYNFTWENLANTYLEFNKTLINENKYNLLREIYLEVLKMLHPFMPFVTEYLYKHNYNAKNYIINSCFSDKLEQLSSFDKTNFDQVIEIMRQIREVKNEHKIHPKTEFFANLRGEIADFTTIQKILRAVLNINLTSEKLENNISEFLVDDLQINITNLIDQNNEKNKKLAQLKQINQEIEFLEKQLQNERFIANAPQHLVEEKKEKLINQQKLKIELEKAIGN